MDDYSDYILAQKDTYLEVDEGSALRLPGATYSAFFAHHDLEENH